MSEYFHAAEEQITKLEAEKECLSVALKTLADELKETKERAQMYADDAKMMRDQRDALQEIATRYANDMHSDNAVRNMALDMLEAAQAALEGGE